MLASKHSITLQGHRGYRALLPENTLPSINYAASLGVDGIEIDVVMTREGNVLVSHDPFMHHEIACTPDGKRISEEEQQRHNIYEMFADEAQRYLMGRFKHPRFPKQLSTKCYKPLLREVVYGLPTPGPWLNIELKSTPEWYGTFQPDPQKYAEQFLRHFLALPISDQTIVQSFDIALLKALHAKAPQLNYVVLNEDSERSIDACIDALGFVPKGYSPHFSLIDEALVSTCADRSLHLIAWTVNEESDLERLARIGVRHFITDEVEVALAWRNSREP